jgi:hypothetical protein
MSPSQSGTSSNRFSELLALPEDITPGSLAGAIDKVANYRGISLIPVISKIFLKLVANRLASMASYLISNTQAGFMPKEETMSQVIALKSIIEHRRRQGEEIALAFIDFNKAYDSVPHHILFRKLESKGIGGKTLKLIKNLYLQKCQLVEENPSKKGASSRLSSISYSI